MEGQAKQEKGTTMKRTVVLVDDHDIVREGIRTLLEAYSDYEIVGQAGDGIEAIHQVERLEPAIVLMDLSLPRMDGTLAIRDIKRRFPKTRVLALTAHKNEETVRNALKAGADGYLLKTTSASRLVEAMDTVMRGERYLCPEIPVVFVSCASDGAPSLLDNLTNRETQILRLVAEGKGNKGMAEVLCISVKTIEKHKANLTHKLGLASASEILPFVREYGLFG